MRHQRCETFTELVRILRFFLRFRQQHIEVLRLRFARLLQVLQPLLFAPGILGHFQVVAGVRPFVLDFPGVLLCHKRFHQAIHIFLALQLSFMLCQIGMQLFEYLFCLPAHDDLP